MEELNPDNDNLMEIEIKEELLEDLEQLPEESIQEPDVLLVNPDPLVFIPPLTQRPDLIEAVPGPSGKQKRKNSNRVLYDASSIDKLLDQIRSGNLTAYQAAKKSGVPRTTLQYRLSSKWKNKGSRGPNTIFTEEEEREIVQQLLNLELRGIPLTQRAVVFKVTKYLKAKPRTTPFKEGQPGKTWVRLFLRRHPELQIQGQDAIKVAESKLCEKVVRTWFRNVSRYFKRQKLTTILADPSRVLNGEMVGFVTRSTKDSHRAYSIVDIANGTHNMTAWFTFAADGSFFAPQMVFPEDDLAKMPRKKLFPADWNLSMSKNGWMNSDCLASYVKKTLRPALIKKGIILPVIYFVRAELAMEAADLCLKCGVILVPLYAGARHIFEDVDTTVYKDLNTTWAKTARTWRAEHKKQLMNMSVFGSLLARAVVESFNANLIKKGFSLRGLYPFDPKMIDYSNSCDADLFIGPFSEDEQTASEDESEQSLKVVIPRKVLDTALTMLGTEKINMYLNEPSDDLCQEDKVLSYVYKNILLPAESSKTVEQKDSTLGDILIEDVAMNSKEKSYISFETEMLTESDDSKVLTQMIVEGDSESESRDDNEIDQSSPKKRSKVENCQMNEVGSSSPTLPSKSDPICFAKEHICSYPRITAHFCKVAKKTKYQSCFMDVTGMYIAYISKCGETSQEPVSSKVYNNLLQNERAKDPKLPTTCDECQHVEKFDSESQYDFLNK